MPLYKAGIIDYTWATKPSVAPIGQIICITDVGENGILCRGNGSKWIRMHPTTFYSLSTNVVLTGTTTETTLLTVPLVGGLLNKTGRLNILSFLSFTNNANAKTVKIKLGGNILAILNSTNQTTFSLNCWLLNLNSETSQRNNNAVSYAIDTSIENDLVITGQLANASDSITLTAVSAEII